MKKIFKFKNSIIMIMGVLLCLSGFISCSSTNNFLSATDGQVIENHDSNNILLTTQMKLEMISMLLP